MKTKKKKDPHLAAGILFCAQPKPQGDFQKGSLRLLCLYLMTGSLCRCHFNAHVKREGVFFKKRGTLLKWVCLLSAERLCYVLS